MNITFILSVIGFAIAFVLLFYFASKYREAAADETNFIEGSTSEVVEADTKTPASITATIKRASMGGHYGSLSLEIEDLKDKIKDMHYRNEELRLLVESRDNELLKTTSKLEARFDAFEEEYVEKLQPTLMSLIEDLQKIKPQD